MNVWKTCGRGVEDVWTREGGNRARGWCGGRGVRVGGFG